MKQLEAKGASRSRLTVKIAGGAKAYLRHLFVAGELFAGQLASEHNLAFYLELVRQARKHIIDGDFSSWKDETVRRIMTRL